MSALCSLHSLLRPLFKVHSFCQSALATRLSTTDITVFLVFVISLMTDQRQPANVQNSFARCQHPVTVTVHPAACLTHISQGALRGDTQTSAPVTRDVTPQRSEHLLYLCQQPMSLLLVSGGWGFPSRFLATVTGAVSEGHSGY